MSFFAGVSTVLILVILILGILTSLTYTSIKDKDVGSDAKNTSMGSMILTWLLLIGVGTGIIAVAAGATKKGN